MSSVKSSWERAARVEPYYAVLSQPQFLASRFAESRAAFFGVGEREVDWLVNTIRKIAPSFPIHSVLEFGCGPGRLVGAFAARGFRVTAVDFAPSMLDVARKNAQEFGALVELAEAVPQEREYDIVNVSRVLQHMPPSEGVAQLIALTRSISGGGFIHLNVPFRSTRSRVSQTVLAARESFAPLNRVANRLRHRDAHVPVFRSHTYSLDAVLAALHDSGCDVVHLDVQSEAELTIARIIARKGSMKSEVPVLVEAVDEAEGEIAPPPVVPDADYLDPRTLIESLTLEELNARAEAYFASQDDWRQQLAKPFSSVGETPDMLISLGVLLHGLRLLPGMTVLDFGGGTGWLSRLLMQLGCNVVLCDVAPTALDIARNFVESHPPIGKRIGTFRSALFDGRTISIGDEQIDRIICFDAFHHVPNIDPVLKEFARVLRPGGLAGFSEPGPEHSRSVQSQFEMRVYGVLEADVDIDAIWQSAKQAGFVDLRLAGFNGMPSFLPLEDFKDLLARGPALQVAAAELRQFTADVRTFLLQRHGVERLDSRTAAGLGADITIEMQATPRAGEPTPFAAVITNIGKQRWLPSAQIPGGVALGAHLYQDNVLLDFDFLRVAIGDAEVLPNETVSVTGFVPKLDAGSYVVEFDCVANEITWFTQSGSAVRRVTFDVR